MRSTLLLAALPALLLGLAACEEQGAGTSTDETPATTEGTGTTTETVPPAAGTTIAPTPAPNAPANPPPDNTGTAR